MGGVREGLERPDGLQVPGGDESLQGGGGMADEEGLLALGAGGGEAGRAHHGLEPVPGHVASEVLLSGVGQKVAVQPV